MAKIGYMRISTDLQDHKLQEDALRIAGCDKIFSDIISGSKTKRTGLDDCLAGLKKGDVLVVWKLDRLGRSAQHLLNIIEDLKIKNVAFVSLKESCDTREIAGKLLFTILSGVAEFERETIRMRVKAGMKAATDGGARMGRDPVLSYKYDQILDLYESGMFIRELAKVVGVSKTLAAKVTLGDWQFMEPDEFRIDKDDFWSKGNKTPNGCIEWMPSFDTFESPYGYVELQTPDRLSKRTGREKTIFPAHRIAFYLANGRIDRTKRVFQTCKNKRCINPEHLTQETV